MLVKSKYLVFPVNKNGTKKRVDFLVDGKRVLYMNIRLVVLTAKPTALRCIFLLSQAGIMTLTACSI